MTTESQRHKRSENKRKSYLKKQLEAGRVPQPRKPAPWLMQLYERYNAVHLVAMPMMHLDDATWKKVQKKHREDKRKLRKWFRDQLPANTPRKDINVMFEQYYRTYMTNKIHNSLIELD